MLRKHRVGLIVSFLLRSNQFSYFSKIVDKCAAFKPRKPATNVVYSIKSKNIYIIFNNKANNVDEKLLLSCHFIVDWLKDHFVINRFGHFPRAFKRVKCYRCMCKWFKVRVTILNGPSLSFEWIWRIFGAWAFPNIVRNHIHR